MTVTDLESVLSVVRSGQLDEEGVADLVAGLPPALVTALLDDPMLAARATIAQQDWNEGLQPHQIPPDGDWWDGWLLMSGRGAGKSFAGARYMHRKSMENPGLRSRILAPTYNDAVASCIESETGILAIGDGAVKWMPTHAGGSILRWENGSVCYVLGVWSPRDLDRLRAITNISLDWWEEAAAIPVLDEAVRLAKFSRRGKGAHWIATSTPRPRKAIKRWVEDERVHVTRATSRDNPHLPDEWLADLEAEYAGTRLYRQEVEGEILEDVDGALWSVEMVAGSRVDERPDGLRFAVGVDPASGSGTTGIVVVGATANGNVYVVEDRSQSNVSAERWGTVAVETAREFNAPLVAENDMGGDMVRAVLKAADSDGDVSIKPARARGVGSKKVRAEPVALLWERDPAVGHIVGQMPLLEEEMCGWVPDSSSKSPDRLDAMVWAVTFLRKSGNWGDMTVSGPTTRGGRGGVSRPWAARRVSS